MRIRGGPSGGNQWEEGGGRERVLGVNNIVKVHYYTYTRTYTVNEDSIMKPTKYCLKKEVGQGGLRKYNGGGEFDQSTLYTSMKISQ
jgi:hypothetical protein